VQRAFKPVVQVGWNIAAFIFGGKIREARDIALFNDYDFRLAYNRLPSISSGARSRAEEAGGRIASA
jgi:hypothetical protein